jgi:hypothetical protein
LVADNRRMDVATLIQDGTTLEAQRADVDVSKSRTPAIYVPRRTHIGGLAGVPAGAAIVGTPQGDGMVAIDVAATQYVDPTPAIWGRWVAEAARSHIAGEDDFFADEGDTMLVSEEELIEVGRFDTGQVLVRNDAVGGRLSAWIEAGRAAFAAGGSSRSWDSLP